MIKILISLLTLGVLFFVPMVYAHVLKTDGEIGAVLHIDPEDNPIAGEQAAFFFEFKDKENKFKIEDCNCNFSILEDGKEIFATPLEPDGIFFSFPQKDIYEVKVTGSPKSDNSFKPFTLTYDVRVEKITTQSNTSPTNYIVFLMGGIIIGVLILWSLRKKF